MIVTPVNSTVVRNELNGILQERQNDMISKNNGRILKEIPPVLLYDTAL
jgi:hypothetical protein